ncbi:MULTISPECIES: flavodoxin domain-containing protein [Rhodococcus]|uniref:Flavodoxin domain-containing protein n=2 Tax=Rhodococcus TaxID=1827 RepID=A0AAW6LSV9_RHOSG|nr:MULTISPECIES: flavodoxin domain-containing protein [Rhodococcus]MDE8649599.1 flavodoxin domain-containing protein [Rhodococcus qingshengii]OMQ29571.1 hypothetical protein BK799_26340 [Rhodococcus sp. D-1]
MIKVLIEYASANGSTRGIARKIADRCSVPGFDVSLSAVEEDPGHEWFDAVIVGSAIHGMDWLPAAREAVFRRSSAAKTQPVWAFSVATWGATSTLLAPRLARRIRTTASEPKTVTKLRESADLRDHRRFAGMLTRGDWPLLGRVVFKIMGGRYSDARDWSDIDEWADGIVEQLRSGTFEYSARTEDASRQFDDDKGP